MPGRSADALSAGLGESPATQEEGRTGGTAGLEGTLGGVLAGVMHTEQVPVAATSSTSWALTHCMAHFCARVRKHGDLPPVSMKDIYAHPTISSLAAALADVAPAAVGRRFQRQPRRWPRPARGVM